MSCTQTPLLAAYSNDDEILWRKINSLEILLWNRQTQKCIFHYRNLCCRNSLNSSNMNLARRGFCCVLVPRKLVYIKFSEIATINSAGVNLYWVWRVYVGSFKYCVLLNPEFQPTLHFSPRHQTCIEDFQNFHELPIFHHVILST